MLGKAADTEGQTRCDCIPRKGPEGEKQRLPGVGWDSLLVSTGFCWGWAIKQTRLGQLCRG